MIIPIVIFSVIGLAFIVLGTMINKQTASGNRETSKLFVALMRWFGLAVIIIGVSYAVLDSKAVNGEWPTDNVRNFAKIALLTPVLMMMLVGVRFIRLNVRGIGRTSAMLWVALWLVIGAYGYVEIHQSGNGWTKESKKSITDKVIDFDRLCYLEQIMEMYDTPEEYNKNVEKDREKIRKHMEENCAMCEVEAEEVQGLPDDF
ncbi:MAG: hypothetical protein NXI10_15235 [bacterium]|nr:hypothetical protein [bacterium]